MPKALTIDEIDPIAEEVDAAISDTGEMPGISGYSFDAAGVVGGSPDLSDGGVVSGVKIRPMPESGRVSGQWKDKIEPGRPVVRLLWMWNGRPTTVPLSWDTSGKSHDGGRRYMLKRHCVVCKFSGFYGRTCPDCRRNGRPITPNAVVPCFYLRKEQTPEHLHAYGSVGCMVDSCIRRGDYGFRNRTEMRQHAMTKHKAEYKAFMDEQAANNTEEMNSLRLQVANLQAAILGSQAAGSPEADDEKPRYPRKTPAQIARANERRRQKREQAKATAAS